jgi:hypothetical protein
MLGIFSFFITLAANAPSLFSGKDSTQWIVLGVGGIATLYLLIRPRLKARKDPLEHRPSLSVSQQRQLERDMSNLMVEMLETARQMTAQLDTRAARLEVLIQQADGRLAALKAGTASGAGGAETASTVIGDDIAMSAIDRHETPPNPRHAEVWAMADQGRSPPEIARQLNRPSGEIELILALRPH